MKLVEFQPSLWSIHLFWFDRSVLAALFPFYAAWYASRHTSCWWRPLLLRIPTTPSIDLCWFDRHPGAGSAWRLLCSFSAAPSLLPLFLLFSFSAPLLLLSRFSACSSFLCSFSAPLLLVCSLSAPSVLLLCSFSTSEDGGQGVGHPGGIFPARGRGWPSLAQKNVSKGWESRHHFKRRMLLI